MSSSPVTPRSKDPKYESEWRFHNNGTPCEWEESYHPGGYHPIHMLDVFNNRYRVIRKLGYGSFSTVWLAVDLRSSRYIALKVLIASSDHQSVISGDILVHDRLQSATNGDYSLHIVALLDSFTHHGPNGTHSCHVYEAMGPNVNEMLQLAPECRTGLQLLHAHGIVHGEVHPGNFLFTINLPSPAANPPEGLQQRPEDRNWLKRIDGMVDLWAPEYLLALSSLYDYTSLDLEPLVKLADFGGAFLEASPAGYPPTPAALRAPELILGERLTTAVDIWSFGCLVFELLTGAPLFQVEGLDSDRFDETENDGHMVQITETIQPLTQSLFDKWSRAASYYGKNREGPLIYEGADLSDTATGSAAECESAGKEVDEEDIDLSDQGGGDSGSEGQVSLAYLRHIRLKSLEEKFTDKKPADIDEREEEDIISLMRLALQPDVASRASATQLLQQPWFSEL